MSLSKERKIAPEERIPEVPKRIFLFRSCTGSVEYPGTESAIKEVLKLLGIDVFMDPDQTCCSGYLLTCSAYNAELSLCAAARNMALAERQGLDVYTFCNGCFGYMRELTHIQLHNPDYRKAVGDIIGAMGYTYAGTSRVLHVQELWYRERARLASMVKRPLNGLRVGVHYGCHYVAQQYGILEDCGYPTFIDEVVELLGGTSVKYKERQMCCGYSVGRGFTHKENVVQPHLRKKFDSAKEEDVELMITVCPGCNTALDREQKALTEEGYGPYAMPSIDYAQLIALALGVDVQKLGFEANSVPLTKVLEKVGISKGEKAHE